MYMRNIMADGLLSNILGMIDRQKQTTRAGLGLLADNPMEFAAQATARYFPTKEEEAQYNQIQAAGGDVSKTPYYQKIFNLSQFQGSIKPVTKTQFEVANEIAQKNATEMLGLPANNTAMDRARAMGFDTDIFHASAKTPPKSIYENGVYLGTIEPELRNLEKVIPNKGGGEGGAFFGTNATDIAKTYAIPTKERAGATYPLKVRSSDFMQSGFNTPMPEGSISQWMKDATIFNRNLDKTKNKYFNEKIKEAKSKGYGGTVFKNVEDAAYDIGSVPMSDIYAINTAPVRSRFAAFDPKRINEPDLLAAGLPFGLLSTEDKKNKKGN